MAAKRQQEIPGTERKSIKEIDDAAEHYREQRDGASLSLMNTAPAAYPFEQNARHFASGVNAPGEVKGIRGWIGIAASEIRAGLLEALEARAGGPLCVFVDSGAFSEVTFGPAGVTVTEEISHLDWMLRFGVYARVARAFRTRAYVVAPDRVGDQVVTLERLTRYARRCRDLVKDHRCQLIVPVQKGALSMGDFWRAAVDALDLPLVDRVGDQVRPIAGVPMKKDATTLGELEAFARELPAGWPIHLLGLGPESKRYAPALEAIRRANPTAEITSDSNTIRRLVGRTNGRGGGARALTQAQDVARAQGLEGSELKAQALGVVGEAQHWEQVKKAYAQGWSDPELEGEQPRGEA